MKTNYCSDKLGISDPNALDNEKGLEYDKFRMDELENNYKFKVGLEFLSLYEFKEEISERSILNGKDLKLVKMTKLE